MYGLQIAMKGMLAQGHGQIYNLEGMGSDGRRIEGLTLYGSTKRAVRYLTAHLRNRDLFSEPNTSTQNRS
jgi:NADP-dependent 3-hydroxy acid dehydrogenase YdfG